MMTLTKSLVRWLMRPGVVGAAVVCAASLLVWVPFFVRGFSCGNDFDFHFESWFEIAQGWKLGHVYPHWAHSPNWSAGEPRFVFYPPLTWVLGALLGVTVGWAWAAPVMLWLLVCATGLAVRALTREWFAEATATLAGCVAMFSGYTLFTAFERGAFGELAAGGLIPLVLLYALRQRGAKSESAWRRGLDGSALKLAVVVTLLWLTNVPAGIMGCYLIAFAAMVAAVVERAWWPVVRAGVAVPLGLLGAAVYILPAVVEQKWIQIAQATSVGMRVEDSWLFARHAAADLAFHDEVLRLASWVVVLMVAVTAAGFAIALLRKKLTVLPRAALVVMAALPVVVLAMQFPAAKFVWDVLPKIYLLQFPWRLLLLMEASMAVFAAAALSATRVRWRVVGIAVAAAGMVLVTGASGLFFYQNCDEDDSVQGQMVSIQWGTGVEGTDEYASTGSDNSLVATGLPQACLLEDAQTPLAESAGDMAPAFDPEDGVCDATYKADVWEPETKHLKVTTDEDGFLVLRLREYPAWSVIVNGVEMKALPHRGDGLVTIPVREGTNQIDVTWKASKDMWVARGLSLSSLPLFFLLWFIERRGGGKRDAAQLK
jgi:hypothetical protein